MNRKSEVTLDELQAQLDLLRGEIVTMAEHMADMGSKASYWAFLTGFTYGALKRIKDHVGDSDAYNTDFVNQVITEVDEARDKLLGS